MSPVYVHGSAVSSSWADGDYSLQELIHRCVSDALRAAGLPVESLEAVVLAAHDLVDGRSLTSMVTATAAAAYLKDETRLGDDGATAFALADARVRSGSVGTCLVAAWGRLSEGPVDSISHALFDPFTTRALSMTEIGVSGLRATMALSEHPGYAAHRDAAADRRGSRREAPERVASPPWPLRPSELPVWSDVVAAVVIGNSPSTVEVRGVGMSTEPYELGDRDLLGLSSLKSASAQALDAAQCHIDQIDVLELDGMTLFDEALALEAVGAAERGAGMRTLATDDRLHPEALEAIGYGPPAMGLTRIARAAERLAAGDGERALAAGASVVAAQSHTAVVLCRSEIPTDDGKGE